MTVKLLRIDLAERWAARINAAQGEAVQSFIETGRLLIAAKKELDQHGEWERMFSDHPNAVDKPIRFSSRTAQMLMVVANNSVIAKAKHASLLPPSWYTLYELTKLDDTFLLRAIDSGTIHPDIERSDARDYSAIPLCRWHHRISPHSYHASAKTFFTRHGLDRKALVKELNERYERKAA